MWLRPFWQDLHTFMPKVTALVKIFEKHYFSNAFCSDENKSSKNYFSHKQEKHKLFVYFSSCNCKKIDISNIISSKCCETKLVVYIITDKAIEKLTTVLAKCGPDFVRDKSQGSFNNYVDQILPNFDHLPPSSGQSWLFYILKVS